jgi:hypothetical protein
MPVTSASLQPQAIQDLSDELMRRLEIGTAPAALSSGLIKEIQKKVPPKSVAIFSDPPKLSTLVRLEYIGMGERIYLYPYIARYRELFKNPPPGAIGAWAMHMHTLRQAELYVILERSTVLLKFLHMAAVEFGLTPTDQTKAFEKAFKKRFDRRLRERHRLTHAHERPSLTSRVIDLVSMPPAEEDKPAIAEALASTLINMASLLPAGPPETAEVMLQAFQDVITQYGAMADREAMEAFALLADYSRATFAGQLPSKP